MSKTRKFAAIDGAGVISVQEGPIPEPGNGEILVEVKASCISSGTELGGIKNRRENPGSSGPRPFGYQNAGIIIAKGENCDEYQIGDKVASIGGGYALHATHACVPKNLSVHIPDGISYEIASTVHLGATGLHAVRRAKLEYGENAAIFGAGTVGQFTTQFSRLSGAHVMVIDQYDLRLKAAIEGGADITVNFTEEDLVFISKDFTRNYGIDASFICFGGDANPALKQIRQMMKVSPDTHIMGRLVIVGGATISHGFGASLGNMDIRSSARPGPGYHDEEYERGKDYPTVFVQWTTKRNLEETLRAVQEGKLKVKPLISHVCPLDEAPDICEEIIQTPEKTLAVVLKP
ncbi:zinc-binding dehydrogenase [Candidatus Poribacteria bacterium]|nr:zinc-binding dehydrogenase [Candidatus Poribacteria bacterium]